MIIFIYMVIHGKPTAIIRKKIFKKNLLFVWVVPFFFVYSAIVLNNCRFIFVSFLLNSTSIIKVVIPKTKCRSDCMK